MCSESKSRPIKTVLSYNDRNALSSGSPEICSSQCAITRSKSNIINSNYKHDQRLKTDIDSVKLIVVKNII